MAVYSENAPEYLGPVELAAGTWAVVRQFLAFWSRVVFALFLWTIMLPIATRENVEVVRLIVDM
jgi:hypothetical protein